MKRNGTNWLIGIIAAVIVFLGLPREIFAQGFALPLVGCADNTPCYVTAYFNHGNDNDHERDWNGGTRTYRRWIVRKGGGYWYYHKGTDIGTNGQARVIVAAKGGRVIEVVKTCEVDNCTGGCCTCTINRTKNGLGNYIKVQHDDGTFALYGHMKTGSARAWIVVGARVSCGDALGEVGSSGCSDGWHLHFEPKIGGVAADPFHGSHSPSQSLWAMQGLYDPVDDKRYRPDQLPGGMCVNLERCTAPGLLVPNDNDDRTWETPYFRWSVARCGNTSADTYRLQVHNEANFPVECNGTNQDRCTIALNERVASTEYLTPQEKALSSGARYFWRVRGGHTTGAGGEWSDVRKFTTRGTSGTMCMPLEEVCDNRDNDCDGEIDEETVIPCETACEGGYRLCDVGRYLPCTAREPEEERCNGRDDDCDGRTDEGLTQGCRNACGNMGTQSCSGGNWSACVASSCSECGRFGQECCENSQCEEPWQCSTNGCMNVCGGDGQYCCEPGNACSIPGQRSMCDPNNDNRCGVCGTSGEQCCPAGNPCNATQNGVRLFCSASAGRACWACGREGDICCPVGAPCESGLTCNPADNHCAR